MHSWVQKRTVPDPAFVHTQDNIVRMVFVPVVVARNDAYGAAVGTFEHFHQDTEIREDIITNHRWKDKDDRVACHSQNSRDEE